MKTQARDMTEGSIAQNIILFYIPLAIGGLFQQLYSFVDSVVVGRGIGAQALAAVGATSIVVWLTLGFAMGLTGLREKGLSSGKPGIFCCIRFVADCGNDDLNCRISGDQRFLDSDAYAQRNSGAVAGLHQSDPAGVCDYSFEQPVYERFAVSGGFVYAILGVARFLCDKYWSGLRICTHTEVGRAGSGCGNGVVSGVLLCNLCRRFEKIEIYQYFGRQ